MAGEFSIKEACWISWLILSDLIRVLKYGAIKGEDEDWSMLVGDCFYVGGRV